MTGYLEKRRQGWYAVVEVTPSLRQAVGKKRLVRSLKTRDKVVAEARKWQVITDLKAEIAKHRTTDVQASVVAEALRYRDDLQKARTSQERDYVQIGIDETYSAVLGVPVGERDGELLYEAARGHKALTFKAVAEGRMTPLDHFVDEWLRDAVVTPRTELDHKRALKRLKDWGKVEALEQIDRKAAGRYVSHLQEPRPPLWTGDAKTVAKYVSSLSAYWRWLERKGHVTSNPWPGQAPPKRARHLRGAQEEERAFTDAEMVKLLQAPSIDPALHDLIRIAALSGMRIEEICQLRVGDCADGVFAITRGKTAAAQRRVPVHSDLRKLVEARCAGKPADAFLIHEEGSVRPGKAKERSMPAIKRFSRLIRQLEIAVLIEGRRRSLVNFHSLRRWFVTKAEQAGKAESTMAALVGHGRPGMTLGRYSFGPSLEQYRDCVESVVLPYVN